MKVLVLGRGKVGLPLAAAAKKAGHKVTLRSTRAGLPPRAETWDLVVLAVRDGAMPSLLSSLIDKDLLLKSTIVVHVAGARGPDFLAALHGHVAGVAQMHPMISFADPDAPPSLLRGNVRVAGDEVAVKRASSFARSIGMSPRRLSGADPVGYHAAAALVANGAAALAAVGSLLLERAGVPSEDAPRMLGPLLRSVADNVERLGLPKALTGPVRRGDAQGVQKHEALIAERLPEALGLYRELVAAQLPVARAITPQEGDYSALEALVRTWRK